MTVNCSFALHFYSVFNPKSFLELLTEFRLKQPYLQQKPLTSCTVKGGEEGCLAKDMSKSVPLPSDYSEIGTGSLFKILSKIAIQ